MKHSVIYLKVVMAVMMPSLPLVVIGQDKSGSVINWNAVKVFDLGVDNVYNIYIDTLDADNVDAVLCFQTKRGELVKTDLNGAVLGVKDNPYEYFACFNGDTLLCGNKSVINQRGDSIASYMSIEPLTARRGYISACQSNIFIFESWNDAPVTIVYAPTNKDKEIFYWVEPSFGPLTGLCCSEGLVFAIQSLGDKGVLVRMNADFSNEYKTESIPVKDPSGITGYGGYLYVYSNSDKALYRLETPQGDGIEVLKDKKTPDNNNNVPEDDQNYQEEVYPLYLDYVAVPDRFFIKKYADVTRDYLISLLEELFDGNYQIYSWIGDDLCKVSVEDALIDNAVTELLKNDSVLIARRVYADKETYENYKGYYANGKPVTLDDIEVCIFNDITYGIKKKYNQNQADSIANVYGLVNKPNTYHPEQGGLFSAPKTVDVFEISVILYETGLFTYIQPDMHMKIWLSSPTIVEEKDIAVHVDQIEYYDMSGQKLDAPLGLTIVVTYYSDGSVRTEKKMMR